MTRGRRDLILGELSAELDRLALDCAVGQHGHCEHDARGERDELHAADRRLLGRCPDDDSGMIGEAGQQLARVGQHLLEGTVRVGEERTHLLGPPGVELPRPCDRVDEEPIALVSRDTSRARVRLVQVAIGLERHHLVAHRRGRHLDSCCREHVVGPDGLRRADVLLHDGLEDRRLSLVQHITDVTDVPRRPHGCSIGGPFPGAMAGIG